jgi:type II secretory pathway pseudopilin PulG
MGFTMVELVSVLIVVSALAAATSSRLFSTSKFDEVAVRDGLLSVTHAAQLASQGTSSVSLDLRQVSSSVEFKAEVGSSTRASRVIPTSETSVQVDAAAYGGTPNACTAVTSPVSIPFHPSLGIESSYEQGFQVCLNNVASFCIAPSGFAYRGACVANGS